MKRILAAIIAAVLLTGCGGEPEPVRDYRIVPDDGGDEVGVKCKQLNALKP
jgi:PBP1b-binding outer membrane lipoprotein LpoB